MSADCEEEVVDYEGSPIPENVGPSTEPAKPPSPKKRKRSDENSEAKVVITNKDSNWTATVYNLQVDWNGETETIISKQIKEVTPKDGWSEFLQKLFDLKNNDTSQYGQHSRLS